MKDVTDKFNDLKFHLQNLGDLAVAFSGGVDSTFLAAVAQDVLGSRALAVNAQSPTYPAHEQKEAEAIAKEIGIAFVSMVSNELEIPNFAENPVNRCYY